MTTDDLVLVERVTRGDQAAFGELVTKYQTPIYNLTYRMLGNAGEAEEAAQEAFLRAYTRLHSFDRKRAFKTWLFSIASNYCIDLLRKRRLTWLSLDEPIPHHPNLVDGQAGPERSAVKSERDAAVQDMLAQLAPKDRIMIVLRYWYDYSYDEIAETTGASVSAVKSRLHRARHTLANNIKDNNSALVLTALLV